MKQWFYCQVLKSLLKHRERYGLTPKQKPQIEGLLRKLNDTERN